MRRAAGRNTRRRSTRISHWLGITWQLAGAAAERALRRLRGGARQARGAGAASIRASRAAARSPRSSPSATSKGRWPRDPDGVPLYPGRARKMSPAERERRRRAGEPFALRLAMDAAVARAGVLTWTETGAGPQGQSGVVAAAPQMWGDVVLARKEVPTSYHLAVARRRRLAGRDRGGARAGPVLVDRHSPAVAGAARPAGAGLSSSPAHSRCRRP